MTFNRRGAGRTGALPLTLSLLIGLAACVGNGDSPSSHAAPEIQVSDHEPLIDEEVQIRVVGLRAHDTVVLDLELESAGNRWIAQASYRSDAAGRVDLAVQAPIGGDYAGVDAMGLFWSARLQGLLVKRKEDRNGQTWWHGSTVAPLPRQRCDDDRWPRV